MYSNAVMFVCFYTIYFIRTFSYFCSFSYPFPTKKFFKRLSQNLALEIKKKNFNLNLTLKICYLISISSHNLTSEIF